MVVNQDRLTHLPCDVIRRILSSLPCVEDAIRTSAVSRPWRNRWRHLSALSFRIGNGLINWEEKANAIDSVIAVYSAQNVQRLEKFVIHIFNEDLMMWLHALTPRMASWISFASNRRIDKVELHFEHLLDGCYSLPEVFYHNDHVIELKTRGCNFYPSGMISWSSLRVLRIEHCTVTNNVLKTMMEGSVHLEFLKLEACGPLSQIKILSSYSMKSLILKDMGNAVLGTPLANPVLEISGPNLDNLEILGYFCDIDIRLMDVPSLNEVTLHFFGDYYRRFGNVVNVLIQQVGNINIIKLGGLCRLVHRGLA